MSPPPEVLYDPLLKIVRVKFRTFETTVDGFDVQVFGRSGAVVDVIA